MKLVCAKNTLSKHVAATHFTSTMLKWVRFPKTLSLFFITGQTDCLQQQGEECFAFRIVFGARKKFFTASIFLAKTCCGI
jgi:hypothetical protein